MERPFVKMNGLGNDFVVAPAGADAPFAPTAARARAIADRRRGIGCDQLIVVGPSRAADVAMRIWNADGAAVEACGNAARCVAWLAMEATGRDAARIETPAGTVEAHRAGPMAVTVDMGAPRLDWRDIPLAREMDTREIDLTVNPAVRAPGCVSMGNPHVVFFVAGSDPAAVEEIGTLIERHPLFPRGVNVGFARILSPERIHLRVWERGAGMTKACGTGACAALVAAHRRGLAGRAATVEMDGGPLEIAWREADGHVLMTGPVAVEFTGRLEGGA
ncbi:MAG: diaminopimelate epimerase [Caulobacteraceae bacterium]